MSAPCPQKPSKVVRLGPYSRPVTLGKLDQRTREAKLLREMRDDLIAHVGGNPTATQRALIERAAQLNLRIQLMDQEFAEANTIMGDHQTRSYLAWTNTLARTLARLGMAAKAQAPRTLAQHMAERTGAAA